MNAILTRDEEINFHYYDFDPISLYFTLVRIHFEETGVKLNEVADKGLRKIIPVCVNQQDALGLKNIKDTLQGLIDTTPI